VNPPSSGKFSQLLLEGLDHYRKGKMLEAVRAWEEAYRLEPTNLRAREFLRSALERIHAHMAPGTAAAPVAGAAPGAAAAPGAPGPPAPAPHPWLPQQPARGPPPRVEPAPPGNTALFASPLQPAPQPALQPAPQLSGKPAALKYPTGPWDDGPSIALPADPDQAQSAGDESSGAWSIHKDPLPIEAAASDEVEVWLNGARELVALNDFSGALELTNKILERKQGDLEARQLHDLCEHNLTLMYESKIGSMEARPSVSMAPDEIIWLNLDPRAGFVLAQIDGEVSFDDLYAICGLRRLDTARILAELLEEGVVAVRGEQQAVAKRALHRR
jgi:tetratricopeptide (TPR) repeat protein